MMKCPDSVKSLKRALTNHNKVKAFIDATSNKDKK